MGGGASLLRAAKSWVRRPSAAVLVAAAWSAKAVASRLCEAERAGSQAGVHREPSRQIRHPLCRRVVPWYTTANVCESRAVMRGVNGLAVN